MGKPKSRAVKRRGVMNGLEERYAKFLASRDDVVSFSYEPVKLKLYKRRAYIPDFFVVFEDGHAEYHEIKAKHRWYEKGLLKLDWAASLYPEFRFVLVKAVKGGWVEEIR